MKCRFALLIGIVAVTGACSHLAFLRGTSSISGRAIDGMTRQPMPGVAVFARLLGSQGVWATVLTDSDGSFAFNRLAPGAYAVQGSAGDNYHGHVGRRDWQDGDRWLAVAAGERMSGVDLVMWPSPTIAGRVTDDEGRPVADVEVRVCRSGARECPVWNNSTVADDLGDFAIALSPGEYVIEAVWRPLSQRRPIAPQRTGPGGRPETYLRTFYPSAGSTAEARKLSVAPGDALTGIDIVLRSAPAFRVSGVIVGTTRAGEFEVQLGDPGALLDCWDDCGTVKADAAGGFEFSRIPPGDYIVRAVQQPRSKRQEPLDRLLTEPQSFGLVPITVVDRDVDVQVPLKPAPTMTGIVRFEGKDSPLPLSILNSRWGFDTIALHAREPQDLDGAFLPNGGFTTIGMPPGHYWLRMNPPEGWYLKSVLVGGRDAADHAVDLPESGVSGAVVTYTSRQAGLAGRVISEPPFERVLAWVTVFTADRSIWGVAGAFGQGFSSRRVQSRPIDHTGAFEFTLPSGDYYVIATETEALPLLPTGAYSALAPLATPITIPEGEWVTRNLRVRAIR